MKCLQCSKETLNPKFCSRSCSVTRTNKTSPKRSPTKWVYGVGPQEKPCGRCKVVKDFTEFTPESGHPSSRCKACTNELMKLRNKTDPETRRKYRLKTLYDMTLEEYDLLFKKQNGLCALNCGREVKVVDHCHETGKIRGLLCSGCNRALGILGDSLPRLERVVEYLQA